MNTGRQVAMAAYLRRLVWLSMLPLLVLAIGLAADSLRRLRASDDRQGQWLAAQLASQLDQQLRQRVLALEVLAASPLLDEGRLADFHRRAQVIRQRFGSELILADREGRMWMHTGVPFGQPLPAMPRPNGRVAAPIALSTGQPAVSDLFMGPIVKRPLVAVAVPVLRNGRADRVLVTTIEMQVFQDRIERAGVPEGWQVALVDGVQGLMAGGFGAAAGADRAEDGGARFAQAIPSAPWTVIVDESAATRRGPLLAALAALALAIAAATGMGWLSGSLGGRRLARSVSELASSREGRTGLLRITEIEHARQLIDDAEVERESAAQALREAHERLATLFESAPVAMLVGRMDDTRLTQVNGAFETLSGYTRQEALGRTGAELGLWVDPLMRQAALEQLQQGGSLPVQQARLRRRGGELIDVSYSSCLVQIGGQAHYLSMIVDTTALQEARRALERQQEELEALVASRTAELVAANAALVERAGAISELYNGAPCGYHSLAADGTIVSVNATELRMLGYSREEFVGQPMTRFMSPTSQALFAERFAGSTVEDVARDLDFDFVKKDGSLLPVLVSAVLVRDADGRPAGARTVVVDNSERKRREQQIGAMQLELARRAEEAEAANRAKSAFLANMSHEIRTPMNAILGLTHLMSRAASDPLQRDRLDKVAGAAKHLLHVINDILDLSKIEAGKMVLEDAAFPLDELLLRAFALVEAPARAKGLELILDTDHVPSQLRGDPTRLLQALVNLLSNAVKFTVAGWVRLSVQCLARDDTGLSLKFEVRDTGEGIAADALPHLFEAFEQADSSTTRRHGGTGLGLALTRHIARMMGGEVGVDSQPGQGSRFWFTARLQVTDAPPRERALSPLAGCRALLVDDLEEALSSLRDQLGLLGLKVNAFTDPQAAWHCALEESAAGRGFELLVLDWRMGPPDGLALLRRLRQVAGLGETPAVLVTAYDDEAMRQQASEAGFAAVLVKPISPSMLQDTLQQLKPGPLLRAPVAEHDDAIETTLRRLHGGRRVLVAEDNPINREVAVELLSSVGLEVDVAVDGMQAVEKALSGQFDLVLMDMQMPELDGLDATRRLRAAGRRELPIVAMTANPFSEDRAACEAAGMNDHLAKPVDPERLYSALLRWLPPPGPEAAGPSVASKAAEPVTALSLQERLGAIGGLDVARALADVGGQIAVLRRVMLRFVQLYADGVSPLDREKAHSLRGALLAIGATDLDAMVQAYESESQQTSAAELAPRAAEIDDQLRGLVAQLRGELAR